MLPVVALVGRPNVGKSTLFNTLTDSQAALVMDQPGVTRDRQYGEARFENTPYFVIDTGGIEEDTNTAIHQLMDQQVMMAVEEADQIIFIVDARQGLQAGDEAIAKRLRKYHSKVTVAINKSEGLNTEIIASEFYRLGFPDVFAISATRARGVPKLIKYVLERCPPSLEETLPEKGLPIAIIGRPNVGKSTLVNGLVGEERMVVFDMPGTTRDAIFVPFDRQGRQYTLIDTAGVRRRSKVDEGLEKFSVIKTLRAIEKAHVVMVLMDATEGVTDQDLKIMHLVLTRGRALVIAMNKWDGLDDYQHTQVLKQMDRRLTFVDFSRRYFISAKHGTGVGKLFHAIEEANHAATREFSTSALTKWLQKTVETHQPPLVSNHRVKLRMAHVGGHFPLTIVIHGKRVESLPGSYQRYLTNDFRTTYDLIGIPIQLRLKNDDNPYHQT
ncbi:MAG TPA: ribosome biogenesis GTPase Der [Coxiellaceae bacterium]|nr:ribosome biogenesis GTPase Der [Coxiellaceae bacterium]